MEVTDKVEKVLAENPDLMFLPTSSQNYGELMYYEARTDKVYRQRGERLTEVAIPKRQRDLYEI